MVRKSGIPRNPIASVFVVVSVCCLFVLFVSVLKLPDPDGSNASKSSKNQKIGKFGEKIIQMLPEDLGFTVFLPSEKAFERDLGLHWNQSLDAADDDGNTYALLTRVLGFSAVPRMIWYDDLMMYEKEVNYDSLSGYVLYINKDGDSKKGLVVNGVRSEKVDLRKGKIVVHLMDGVVMDPDFQQSVSESI